MQSQNNASQSTQNIYVVIPAFNEENSIAKVIQDIPVGIVKEILVGNNNSSDKTAENAEIAGATVVNEPRQGYGFACLKALDYIALKAKDEDIIVFLDGDYSDYPQQLPQVISPIINKEANLVIGSRSLGKRENGSMTLPQVFGNWLATTLMKWLYKTKFTDLGPFRAIDWKSLKSLNMQDTTYGWTVEMQIKAAKANLNCVEVPVNYRKRIGVSKVSGTIKGVIFAGYKIIWLIFKYA